MFSFINWSLLVFFVLIVFILHTLHICNWFIAFCLYSRWYLLIITHLGFHRALLFVLVLCYVFFFFFHIVILVLFLFVLFIFLLFFFRFMFLIRSFELVVIIFAWSVRLMGHIIEYFATSKVMRVIKFRVISLTVTFSKVIRSLSFMLFFFDGVQLVEACHVHHACVGWLWEHRTYHWIISWPYTHLLTPWVEIRIHVTSCHRTTSNGSSRLHLSFPHQIFILLFLAFLLHSLSHFFLNL